MCHDTYQNALDCVHGDGCSLTNEMLNLLLDAKDGESIHSEPLGCGRLGARLIDGSMMYICAFL